ncbi:hypothetical protein SJR95_10630 [Aeromonas caviae]|uniref:hypothetical protein n=1 Tax=Aeromonas caviae TaxID=648 RepID=UPI0029DA0939|nr:hypothetical protein [Aeromonas caviae]MDX7860496.1 hypothetical protein [Aeromonas caviae]
MNIDIYGDPLKDEVLGAKYLVGRTDYRFAIEHLYPLIIRLEIQRGLQNPSFYSRLRSDLKKGCIVPPVTLAFVIEGDIDQINPDYVHEHISDGFVLDGIQRLSAIHQAAQEIENEVDREIYLNRTLHLNIIVSPSMDRLLYRMITLNNGQKPMSPRHQIDILSQTVFDFENLTLRNQPYKARQRSADVFSVHRSDIVKGYIAYFSNTTAIDNKLIIEEKMDDLIAEKIIDSNIVGYDFEFLDILNWIADVCTEKGPNKWFVTSNNLIGFCVASRNNFGYLRNMNAAQINHEIVRFEHIFANFDKRKIKVGDYRRKMVAEYFGNLQIYFDKAESDVVLELSQK